MHEFGVSHADDLYYNFDFSSDQCARFTEEDFQVAYDMALFFTNFARTGDPNIKDSLVKLISFFIYMSTILVLTGGLAARYLSPNHGKCNFEFLCDSLRSTTKMKLTTQIFHP